MIIGQTIRAPLSASATYYSPWFPRQGTKALVACNVIEASEVQSFTILVETKSSWDDNETGTGYNVRPVGTAETITISTPDTVYTFSRGNSLAGDEGPSQGFKDLVRLVYTLTSNSTKKSWLHFRMLNTSWQND